jgi:predicted metal-dependent hydrolase
VDVFAPPTAADDQIQAAVMKKAAWIAGKLDATELYQPVLGIRYFCFGLLELTGSVISLGA